MNRNLERNKRVLELRKSGKKLAEIAKELNVCTQRVSQLCASESALNEIREDKFYSIIVDDENNKVAVRCYSALIKAGITNEKQLSNRWNEIENAEIQRIGKATVEYLVGRLNSLGLLDDVKKIS